MGEADHPESSIVAISRVSHNVVELWWEGNVLMGKLEILMSPGFVNQGIISCEGDQVANLLRKGLKIGVSSRGVGSLKKENGENIVQDDFELICWDVVTSHQLPDLGYIPKSLLDNNKCQKRQKRKIKIF